MPGKPSFAEFGNQYGKPDIERLGIFLEMPYSHGTRYTSPFKEQYLKGKNMMCEGFRSKCATDVGYFEPFKRVFEGEGKGRKGAFKLKKERLVPFVPAGAAKKHGCPGDYFGSFGGTVEAFGTGRGKKQPYKRLPRNFVTNPIKKGGPGYPNICLNPYPEHSNDRYGFKKPQKQYGSNLGRAIITAHHTQSYFDKHPFVGPDNEKLIGSIYKRPDERKVVIVPPGKFIPTGPGKWQGGSHAGCFDKFPEHSADKYEPKPIKGKSKKPQNYAGTFYPQSMAMKSYLTSSIISENARFRVNFNNYKIFQPTYIKHLM